MNVILIKKPFQIAFTGNPMAFTFCITPYGTVERTQDVRLQVRVLLENNFGSGIFEEVRSQNFYPKYNGNIELDVQTIVDPYLEYYIPRITLQRAVDAVNQRKRYKVSWLLQVDGAVVGGVQETSAFFALKGGMAYDQWHPTEFFERIIIDQKRPLSFSASGEKTFVDEIHFLYWLNTSNVNTGSNWLIDADDFTLDDNDGDPIDVDDPSITGVREPLTVHFKIHLDNGVEVEYDLPGTASTEVWGVMCAPVGYHQVRLSTQVPSDRTPVWYEVSVVGDSGTVVDPYRYNLDQRNYYNTKHLVFRNSVGGLDKLRMRGQVEFEADYVKQNAQRTIPPSYYSNMSLLPQRRSTSEETPKEKGDTGFISKAAAEKLRDLFMSPEVWEVRDGKLVPVEINTKNAKFFANRDNLISIQVEWQTAYVNRYYTPAGLMPINRSCPAVETLQAVQINRNTIMIIYALALPYDRVMVEVGVDGVVYEYTYTGNAKSIVQTITAPATTPATISIQARTICDEDSDPMDLGPWKAITLSMDGNRLPIANNDNYNINAGYNSPVVLAGSVMANDYDPDNDPIEVVAATGGTNAGGVYSISASGIVTFTPVSSVFNGTDYFDYELREIGSATTVTARVYIHVGVLPTGVFAKLVFKSLVYSGNVYNSQTTGEVWLEFYGDPAGSGPLDVTALNLTFNVQLQVDSQDFGGGNSTVVTAMPTLGIGSKMKIYDGVISEDASDQGQPYQFFVRRNFTLQGGTGYVII